MEDEPQPVRVEDELESPPKLEKLEENGSSEVTHPHDNLLLDDEDDENDTIDEESHHSQIFVLPDDYSMKDESMMTATMDASKYSSSHRIDSDSDSFLSCASHKEDLGTTTDDEGGKDDQKRRDANNTSRSLRSITLEMATSGRESNDEDDSSNSSRNEKEELDKMNISGADGDDNSSTGSRKDQVDSSSNNDDSDSDCSSNSGGSEYSESMHFSSIRTELELGYKTRRRSSKKTRSRAAPEGAPGASEISGTGTGTTTIRRHSRAHRLAEKRGSGASESSSGKVSMRRTHSTGTLPASFSPRTPPRRAPRPISAGELKSLKPVPSLDYGHGSPGGGLLGGGGRGARARASSVRGGRGLAGTRGRASFARSATDEGPRRPMMRRAATERFVYSPENGDDGRPKFKRRARSRSMDLGASGQLDDPPIRRISHNNRISVAFGHSREQSHYQPRVIRKGKRMDLQTGGETYRDVLCQRIIDYPEAMNPNERRRKTVMRTGNEVLNQQSMHGNYNEPQYRLQSRVHAQHRFHKEQMQTQSVQPGPLTTYLIWSLRSNFVIVLLSEACAFWVMICVFAICIYLGALYQPECLRFPDNTNFEENGSYFIDAFALSWTTFSTVGYGVVYPQIRREVHQTSFNCAFMTTLTALEAFVGVLFASFCGAVIVGKMTRAKCTASVRFSERMIVRFGTGVMHTNDDDDRCDDRGEKPVSEYDKRRLLYPCPVLEFRLANTLFENVTGEIMNAKLSVVSSTLAEKKPADTASLRTSVIGLGGVRPGLDVLKGMTHSASQFLLRPFGESGSVSSSDVTSTTSTNNLFLAARRGNSNSDLDSTSNNSFSSFRNILWSSATGSIRKASSTSDLGKKKEKTSVLRFVSQVGKDAIENVVIKKRLMRTSTVQPPMQAPDDSESNPIRSRRNATVMEEDPANGLTPRKLFSSLKIESDTHPFFKRVWTIRHVLNADSPLISERAKVIIKASKGRWPAETCNHFFIRKNVDFQQLIVSLSGTTTGNNVYGLHVYEYRNLHVGYTFSPIMQTTPDGRLVVDVDSIDNIQEQRGGGAEAVNYYEVSINGDDSEERQQRRFLRRVEKPVADISDGPSHSNSDVNLNSNSDVNLNLTTERIEEVDESILSSRLRSSTQSRQGLEEDDLFQRKAPPRHAVSFEGLPRVSL